MPVETPPNGNLRAEVNGSKSHTSDSGSSPSFNWARIFCALLESVCFLFGSTSDKVTVSFASRAKIICVDLLGRAILHHLLLKTANTQARCQLAIMISAQRQLRPCVLPQLKRSLSKLWFAVRRLSSTINDTMSWHLKKLFSRIDCDT